MSASVQQECLAICILVDGFMLSKITERTVFNTRNPSNLPGDTQGAQMNECKKHYLEREKKGARNAREQRKNVFPGWGVHGELL